ncbi:zinc finger protein with KRAB and SCAN domains 8 isoform X2 [Drosophila ficusphila]|uniref:zinc finger protein with KRAB and SCAN domains 8 isoform X2 n=1 Tax=Drosophila ficusphila TaxID=30025 RepID=UPI0007E611FD|nr:zinc finger protein with KRAB and SCAN domains 8 isoform X2 [Drosophila ficusphila]
MEAPPSYPDLATLCRLCLKEHQDAYAIFEADDAQLSIPVRLMACVALDAKAADTLPKKICQECRYQLEKSFLFRQRCQAVEKKLRKHIRLLGMGKRSRVFSKDPDDYDEDELEFEDSIAFIESQDKVRKQEEEKWREEFKEEQAAEFNKRLVKSRLEIRAKLSTELRKTLSEEVRNEVREELIEEVRIDVRDELRNEVCEEMRKEQLAMLLGELEVYLTEKKAGQWEPLEGSETKSQAKEDTSAVGHKMKPSPKRPSSPGKSQMQQPMKEEKEFILECNSEPLSATPLEEEVPTESGNDFRDIEMVESGDVVRTDEGEIYIINSTSSEDQKPDSTPEFDEDNDITSYNIKEDGEIQFSGEKSEEMEDVVVFNLDSEISEEQQVFNFDENVIIEKEQLKREDLTPVKRKRSSDFVFKQTASCPQPQAGRVTDTVKSFPCHLCPVAFATQKLLTRHHNTHIKGLKSGKGGTLKCPSCSLQLSCASSLKRHMIIHTGLKPFKCEECDQAFSQREVLKRHMDTHTGAKRHQCPQCSSCFAQKSNLQQHIGRVHMGNSRQHKCHLCQRSFNHVSGLSRHLVTHAGVMFSCKQCGRQFNDRSAVQRHVTTMHKVKNKSADYISEPEISEIEFQAV